MKKIRVKIEINEYKIEKDGMINNDLLTCFDNDELKTKISFDFKNQVLTRENKEIVIRLDFKSHQLEYTLKSVNKTILNNFIILKLIIKNKEAIINYQIEEENFKLKLFYEEKEKN